MVISTGEKFFTNGDTRDRKILYERNTWQGKYSLEENNLEGEMIWSGKDYRG